MKKLTARLKHLILCFDVVQTAPSKHTYHLTFESGKYNQMELVKAINDALPHFALTVQEYEELKSNDDVGEMYRKAWTRISTAKKDKKGDYGEILLFLLLNTFFDSPKFVTKVRLRSSRGEQIKGYDCAHFTVDGQDKITLWLGEAKFHKSFSKALSSVIDEIRNHTEYKYVKNEMSILSSNVEYNKDMELKAKLEELLDGTMSLDDVRIVIPALLTYDSKVVKYHSSLSDVFLKDIEKEFADKLKQIDSSNIDIPSNFTVKFLLLPLREVSTIKDKLDAIEKAQACEEN